MRNTLFIMKYLIIVLIVITACQNSKPDPYTLFNEAKERLLSQEFISYRQTFYWPNMLDEIDTIAGSVKFQKNTNSSIGYDFVTLGKKADMVFVGGELKIISHIDSTLITHSAGEDRSGESFIRSIYFVSDSPLILLDKKIWEFSMDTIIDGVQLYNYYSIEKDTIIEGRHVYSEHHLFVNPHSKLFGRYEWRAFLNGKKSQIITAVNDDFTMDAAPRSLEYILPANYVSVLPGSGKKRHTLEVTNKAPAIEAFDLAGNGVRLADFKGEKVLLNFSIINCGWCKSAIDYLNEGESKFNDSIKLLYINPVDSVEQIEKYAKKFRVPGTIIPNAKAIGEDFNVSGFPTFYLIDEDGKIEAAQVGFNKEFFEKL